MIMNNIDICTETIRIAANFEARQQTISYSGNVSTKDATAKSGPDNTRDYPEQTATTFSTYGLRDERISVVVKNQYTGEVIHETPSKELQKLHIRLDKLV